jgi:site-specific recombinase XerD
MPDPPTPTDPVPANTADEYARAAAEKASEGGLAERTKAEYARHFERFEDWCEEASRSALPADVETVCAYFEARQAEGGVSASTLEVISAAIRHAHHRAGKASPTSHPACKRYMDNRRKAAEGEGQGARPLFLSGLKEMLRTCDTTGAKGLRDRALLLVGWAGAFRRSELAALEASWIEERPGGYLVRVPTQKNRAEEQVKGLPETGTWTSPASALEAWMEAVDEAEASEDPAPGPGTEKVFRRIDRWGHIWQAGLSGQAIYDIIQARGEAAGLDLEGLSPHSLRKGFMSEAGRKGASLSDTMSQSGHKDEKTALGYIEAGGALQNPAVQEIGL